MPTYSGPSHLVPLENVKVTLVDQAGSPINSGNPLPTTGAGGGSTVTANQGTAGSAQWPTSDTSDIEYIHVTTTVTSAGSTVVYTPASGKRIRLRWVYAINDPSSTGAPLIQIFIGANEYYRCYALSKRQQVTGPVNGALSVTLSQGGSVAFTAILEEI